MDSSGFGVVGLWDPGGLGFWGPLPCASPPEVRTAMALPTPRVPGCRSPAGLWGIFLPGKNREKREIRANPKAGRAEGRKDGSVPPGGAASAEWHRWGRDRDRDTGTPGQPRWHRRDTPARGALRGLLTGASLFSLLVPVSIPYWCQSVLTGSSLSLLVPVCFPCGSYSALLTGAGLVSLLGPVSIPCWGQSVLTGPSPCSQRELLCPPYWSQSVLTSPSLHSLLVPVCIPCGYWSTCLTGASLSSLLVSVRPYQSQSLFPVGSALHSSLVPVCFPYWSPSPSPAGASPGSGWLPTPVRGHYWSQSAFLIGPSPHSLWDLLCPPYWSRSVFPVGSALLSLLVPLPVPC